MVVDSDHPGYKATRSSRTSFLIYVNMVLITWLSIKQPTIESFVFGVEFIAMKTGMEALRGIRKRFEWWACHWLSCQIFMEITCLLFKIFKDQSQPWRRKTTKFAIMKCGSLLKWVNHSLLTLLLSLTLLICWQIQCLDKRRGVWWKGCCMMSLIYLFILFVAILNEQNHWNEIEGTVEICSFRCFGVIIEE